MDLSSFPDAMAARALVLHLMHWTATFLEIAGVLIIVFAAIVATSQFLFAVRSVKWEAAVHGYRASLGVGILLGLEFLVAADIIGTVAVTPTFQSLGVLALLITIRTFLSLALGVEIEGRWPWKRDERGRA
jgi:uncharacterized membrane protein